MKSVLFTVLVAFGFNSFAQESNPFTAPAHSSEILLDEVIESAQPANERLKLFFGAGLGITDGSSRYNTNGFPKHFKVDGSYYAEEVPWVFDLGLGLSSQNFEKSGKASANGLLFEAAGRYEFNNGYQLGPVMHTLINQGDKFNTSNRNALFLGVQGLKEVLAFEGRYTLRLGAKLMTDVNANGQTINMGMIEAALGIPLFSPTRIIETTSIEGEDELDADDTELVATSSAIDIVKHDLRADVMQFELNPAKLKARNMKYSEHVARTLKNNAHLYGSVERRDGILIFRNVNNAIALREMLKSLQ